MGLFYCLFGRVLDYFKIPPRSPQEIQTDPEIKDFLSRRCDIYRAEFVIIVAIVYAMYRFDIELTFWCLSFLWIIFGALIFIRQRVWRLKDNEWIAQIIFENIFFFSQFKKYVPRELKKWYDWIKGLSIVIFFLISITLIVVNFWSLVWIINIYPGNFVLSEYLMHISIPWGDAIKWIYSGILSIVLSQKVPYILKVWWNYSGTMFMASFFLMPFLSLTLKNSEQTLLYTGIMWFWWFITLVSMVLWLGKMSFKKPFSQDISEDSFRANYMFRSLLNKNVRNNHQEVYQIYKKWRDMTSSSQKFLRNNIPYILDTPIVDSNDDLLWLKKITEEVFQFIANIQLFNDASAVIIWIDWPRGSGKTSLTNMLRNDYLAYVDRVLVFEFRAWSYSKNDLMESFLKDLGRFSEANGIHIEKELRYYIDTLSKIHTAFWFFSLFAGNEKTSSERVIQISKLIKDSGKKIVVIIDDVDRISHTEDFESLLKLLRSTANFHGVFYVLNYSEQILRKDEQFVQMVNDFEEKFINFKVKMPDMTIIWYGEAEGAKYLREMILQEIWRWEYMIENLIKEENQFIQNKREEFKANIKKIAWKTPEQQESFLEFLEDYQAVMLRYFKDSIISCLVLLVDNKIAHAIVNGKEIKDEWMTHAICTPRKAKHVINETLRLLSTGNNFFNDFFNDLAKYVDKTGYTIARIPIPINKEAWVSSFLTDMSFWKRLKEAIKK